MERIIDVIDPQINFQVEESKEVDGVHVLGKVKGQFFVPNGYSRNQRYYPRELWEKVLESKEVKEKLKSKRMLGTIGHNVELTDENIGDGKVSHIVTNLYIDEQGRGIGEALILNTPAGRVLNTLLRAGAKLYVSSRAFGKYEGKDPTGKVPALDPNSYKLITFDFVYEPGFLQANPQLVESIVEDLKKCSGGICEFMNNNSVEDITIDKEKEDFDMTNEEFIKMLTEEKISLQKELEKLLKENEELKKELESAKKVSEEKEELSKQIESLNSKIEKLEVELKKYEELGKPEEIASAIDKAKEKLEALKDFEERVGTLEEVEKALILAQETLLKIKEEKERAKVEAIAKEFNVEVELVENLLKALPEAEVKETLSKLTKVREVEERYKQESPTQNKKEESIIKSKSRVAMLTESLL